MIYGRASTGHPVYWDKAGALPSKFLQQIANAKDGKESVGAYLNHCTENLMRVKMHISHEKKTRYTKHVLILDAGKLGLTNLNYVRGIVSHALSEVQCMYPESLQKAYIINAGWLFRAAWAVVDP